MDPFSMLCVRIIIFRFRSFIIIPRIIKMVAIYRRLTVVSMRDVTALVFEVTNQASVTRSPFTRDKYLVSYVFRCFRSNTNVIKGQRLSFQVGFRVATCENVSTIHTYRRAETKENASDYPQVALHGTRSTLYRLVSIKHLRLFLSMAA